MTSHIVDIPLLDEIVQQIGAPTALRFCRMQGGACVAVARFQHSGAALDLSASACFRVVFHVRSSTVLPGETDRCRVQDAGSIVTSSMRLPERVCIRGAADTIHLIFPPGLSQAQGDAPPRSVLPLLRAAAVQAVADLQGDALQRSVGTIAGALQRRVPDARGGLSPLASMRLRQMFRERTAAGVSVPELAQAAGLSLHHFIRAFCQSEGCTPHRYLVQRRIELGIGLLSQPGVRVDEAALRSGFCSPSHFISSFRAATGVTPAAYQRAAAR